MTLKSKDQQRIEKMFKQLDYESQAIIDSIVEISWFMRGGLQYKDAFDITPFERDRLKTFIEKHLKSVEKHPYPQY